MAENVIERVMSGVFEPAAADAEGKNARAESKAGGAAKRGEGVRKEIAKDESARKDHVEHQERAKRAAEHWAGRGLGLLPDGLVPRGRQAVEHAAKELASGAARGAMLGLSLKGALSLVMSLIKGKQSLREALTSAVGPDSQRFAAFMSAFIGTFRFVNAGMTALRGRDTALNSGVAGGVAALTLMIDAPARRKMFAMNLFVRSLDVLTKRLVRDGALPYWKHFEAFLFGVTNIPIMYGFLFEPDILDRGYYKWILGMGNVTDEGLENTLRVRRKALAEGRFIPHQPCSVGYHEGPCTVHCVKDWFYGLQRASKVYVSVHLISLILRYKKLGKDPLPQLLRTLVGFASSCAFLSTYVFCIKSSQCFLRNSRQVDSDWHAVVAGMLTSLSTMFERPSRVSELMLYCMPKALEGAYVYLHKRGYVGTVRNFDTMLFAFSMSVLCSSARTDFKSTYHATLCFVLGAPRSKSSKSLPSTPAAAASAPASDLPPVAEEGPEDTSSA